MVVPRVDEELSNSSALTAVMSLGHMKIGDLEANITEAECCWHIHFWQETSERLHYPGDGRWKLMLPEPGPLQVSDWLCASSEPSACARVSPRALGSKEKNPQDLNAFHPTFVPKRPVWIHWSDPPLGGFCWPL